MASDIRDMREEATCSICLQLMMEPMSIRCGHSFCRQCIQDNIKIQPRNISCPLCQTPFLWKSLRPMKQLENIISILRKMEQERPCEEHGEKLQLFCKDDKQLICWLCEWSGHHKGHSTALVKDVYPGYKEKFQEIVTKLKEKQVLCNSALLFMKEKITEWEENIDIQRQKIQSEFMNLHSFLVEEEKRYLWTLEKEKEQVLSSLQDDKAILEKQSLELKNHTLELEKKCQGSVQNLLQDVEDTLKRYSDMKLEIPEVISLEPQTACSVSELYFDVKKMFKSCQVHVNLDPDTAHPELILSEDQKQVTRGETMKKHVNSKRFTALPSVLGCERFTSGRYYFEVDVGEGSGWDLGVCLENVQRDKAMNPEPQSGFWAIRLCPTKGLMALTSPPTFLLKEKPLLVGVLLDGKIGLVSFYNMTTGSHIFTFPKASFSDILRPYFQVSLCSPLFLPPPYESI